MPIAPVWPTRDELDVRDAVEAELDFIGIGKITGAGGGMNTMHLTYRANDDTIVPSAHSAIADAMKKHMPDSHYDIKVREGA